jgi:hypothetical protein
MLTKPTTISWWESNSASLHQTQGASNTRVIQVWGATLASTVTYLTPLVGVTLGILVLGESLQWNEPVGAALVLLGIVISQGLIGRLVRPTRREPERLP